MAKNQDELVAQVKGLLGQLTADSLREIVKVARDHYRTIRKAQNAAARAYLYIGQRVGFDCTHGHVAGSLVSICRSNGVVLTDKGTRYTVPMHMLNEEV